MKTNKKILSNLIWVFELLEELLWNIADFFMALSVHMENVVLGIQMNKEFGKENKRCPQCGDIWVWEKTERDDFDIVCRGCGKVMYDVFPKSELDT